MISAQSPDGSRDFFLGNIVNVILTFNGGQFLLESIDLLILPNQKCFFSRRYQIIFSPIVQIRCDVWTI